MKSSIISCAVAAAMLVIVACGSDDGNGDEPTTAAPATEPARPDAGPAPAKEAGGGGCGSTEPSIDVENFPKCLDGGRCVPAAAIPEPDRKRLNECPGGSAYCVPEKFLAMSGEFVPTSCTSLAGGEGRCLSRLFKDIDAEKDSLPQDVCTDAERCAPCYDPVDGTETGACSLSKCDSPKKPKVVFGECCNDVPNKPGGRCVPKSLIPADDQDHLETKECKADELCAPKDTLAATYVPPKCTASSLLGSYDGVCVSDCIKKDFLTDLGTDQGSCAAGYFCAPCKDPLSGDPTGAPGCAP